MGTLNLFGLEYQFLDKKLRFLKLFFPLSNEHEHKREFFFTLTLPNLEFQITKGCEFCSSLHGGSLELSFFEIKPFCFSWPV